MIPLRPSGSMRAALHGDPKRVWGLALLCCLGLERLGRTHSDEGHQM